MIIGIQRDTARVLTSSSTPDMPDVRVVRGSDIQRKLNPKNMVTTDTNMNQVCSFCCASQPHHLNMSMNQVC
jgi:hypothetical protein